MSAATDALYQELILEHNRKPRNFGTVPDADRVVEGKNPMCGDEVTLSLKLDGDTITDIRFASPPGRGCAISKASASLMTGAVKGKSRADAESLFESFHKLVKGELPAEQQAAMGSLRAFGGISRYPMRVKCASLAWHALRSALGDESAPVSTEGAAPLTEGGER